MADAKRPPRRPNGTRPNNSRSESGNGSKGKENEAIENGEEWETARPSRGQQQRLKISDVRRAPKKPQGPLNEAPEFFPQAEAEKFSEKFSTRPGRGGGKKAKNAQPWLSEQDQVTELGARLQKLDARKGLGASFDGYVKRNPLVSQ
jgi:hypothetical protein